MSARGALYIFTFLTGRLLKRGVYQRGSLISKFSKLGIQICHVRFKIKYHPSIFEKYRLFTKAEQISKAQNKAGKYFFKD